MEQRPLRLGDIVDDYCPRERRVTNHAIVAMIEEAVRQTRCTTCDAEHAYKGGKAPRTRAKKGSPEALYKEVLAGMPEAVAPALAAPAAPEALVAAPEALVIEPPGGNGHPPAIAAEDAAPDAAPDAAQTEPAAAESSAPAEEPPPAVEEGPVHRPLIRATLPRPEGHKEARALPDFTMRQPLGRGRFRSDGRNRPRGGGNGQGGTGNGHRGAAGPRFGSPRPGGRRNRGR